MFLKFLQRLEKNKIMETKNLKIGKNPIIHNLELELQKLLNREANSIYRLSMIREGIEDTKSLLSAARKLERKRNGKQKRNASSC